MFGFHGMDENQNILIYFHFFTYKPIKQIDSIVIHFVTWYSQLRPKEYTQVFFFHWVLISYIRCRINIKNQIASFNNILQGSVQWRNCSMGVSIEISIYLYL